MDFHSDDFQTLRRRAHKQIGNDKGLIEQLSKARKALDVSQEELAFRMGVTQPAVSAIENGNSDPKLGTIRRYANALGFIVSYQIARSDESDESDESWSTIPDSRILDETESDRCMFATVAQSSDYQTSSFEH